MRYSVIESDPGYKNYLRVRARGSDIKVKLDGKPVLGAVTADDQIGQVTRLLLNEEGSPEVDWTGRQLKTETVKGKVDVAFIRSK